MILVVVNKAGNPISSIAYHNISPYNYLFNEYIRDCKLIKTGINYACFSSFGKNRWSHWGLLCITDSGKIIISPAKYGSFNVYNATHMGISKVDNVDMLIPPAGKHAYDKSKKSNKEHLGKWLIESKSYPLDMKVSECIELFADTIKNIKYNLISTNCQFISQYFLYKYSNADFPEVDPIKIITDAGNDFINGIKIKH